MYQQQQDPMRTVLGKLFPLMINSGNPFLMGAGMAGGLLSSLFGGQEQTQVMGGGVSRGQAPPESFVGPVDAGAGGSIPGVDVEGEDDGMLAKGRKLPTGNRRPINGRPPRRAGDEPEFEDNPEEEASEGGEGPLAWGGGRQEVNPPLPSLPTRPGAAGYGAVPGIIPQGTGSPAASSKRSLADRAKSQMLTSKHQTMANPGLFQGSTLGKAQGMRPTLEEIIQSPPQSQKQGGPGAGYGTIPGSGRSPQGGPGAGYRATAGSGRSPQGGSRAGYGATAGGAKGSPSGESTSPAQAAATSKKSSPAPKGKGPSQVGADRILGMVANLDTSPSSDVNLSDENPVLKQISSLESRIAQLKESLGASSGSGSSEESSGPARDFDPRYDGEVYSNADLTMESMFSALGL